MRHIDEQAIRQRNFYLDGGVRPDEEADQRRHQEVY